MPSMVWPTWLSMLLLDSTRMKDGSFSSSCSWGFHLMIKRTQGCEPTCVTAGDMFENNTSPFRVREVDVGPKFNDLSQ